MSLLFIGFLAEQYAKNWGNKGEMKAVLPKKYQYKVPVVLITSTTIQTSNLVSTFLDDLKAAHSQNALPEPL